MSKAWTKLDLEGGGLQSANLRLAALLRKRGTAYALLTLFPLGLHRAYLQDRRGAWLFRAASLLCVAAYLLNRPVIGGVLLAALAAGALYDLFRMENRVARINRQLRVQVYLGQTSGAPPGFKGRFTDNALGEYPQDRDQECSDAAPTHGRPSRLPSFAEQEKLLRELAATRRGNGK